MKTKYIRPEMGISFFGSEEFITGSAAVTAVYDAIIGEDSKITIDDKKMVDAANILKFTF